MVPSTGPTALQIPYGDPVGKEVLTLFHISPTLLWAAPLRSAAERLTFSGLVETTSTNKPSKPKT